jgi:hypothetical protein
MKYEDLLKRDHRSRGLTPRWVDKQLSKIPLSQKIHPNIINMIELTKNILYHGYLKYEFYNLALFYMSLTFEAALRIKYNKEDKPLFLLLKRANQDKIFPEYFTTKPTHIRRYRNAQAHPRGITVIPLSIYAFQMTIYLINCIFDEDARNNYPAIFMKDIETAKRNKILQDALFRIAENNIIVGQEFEIAGISNKYEKGVHICAKCKSEQIINKKHPNLLLCENCGETIFLLGY